MTDLSMEERKIATATHKQATTKLNEENKKKQYEAALDANLPALNANHTSIKSPTKRQVQLLAEQETCKDCSEKKLTNIFQHLISGPKL